MVLSIRLALVAGLTLCLLGVSIGPSVAGVPVTVKTRMTGWQSKYHGDYVYRAGDTAGLEVGVWPKFPGVVQGPPGARGLPLPHQGGDGGHRGAQRRAFGLVDVPRSLTLRRSRRGSEARPRRLPGGRARRAGRSGD